MENLREIALNAAAAVSIGAFVWALLVWAQFITDVVASVSP